MENALTAVCSRWMGRLTHPLGAALLLLLVCFGLHRSALSGGWQFDDGANLLMAAKYAPWQYFFVPEVMLESTPAHITPWNVFFYEMGLPFFGLNPVGHYVHLLLVLWGGGVCHFLFAGRMAAQVLCPVWCGVVFSHAAGGGGGADADGGALRLRLVVYRVGVAGV